MAKKAAVAKPEETKPAGLTSVDDLNAALREWGEIDAKEKALTEALTAKVNVFKNDCAQKMIVVVSGAPVTFATRRALLKSQIEEYCEEHKTELLEGSDKKSREFTHGTISWRKAAPSLVDTEAAKPESIAAKFIDHLVGMARTCLKAVKSKLFPGLVPTDLITIKIEWNKTLLFEKYKSKEISLDVLKSAGFDIQGGDDSFSAKPASVMVKTEAEATP